MSRQRTPTMTRAIGHADVGKDTSTHARYAELICWAHAHGHHGREAGPHSCEPWTCPCTQRAPPRALHPPRLSRRRHHAHAHADIRHNTRAPKQACSPRMSQPGSGTLSTSLAHSRGVSPRSTGPKPAVMRSSLNTSIHSLSSCLEGFSAGKSGKDVLSDAVSADAIALARPLIGWSTVWSPCRVRV